MRIADEGWKINPVGNAEPASAMLVNSKSEARSKFKSLKHKIQYG